MLGIFSMKDEIRFPKNFVWGSATAGHQIEGDNIHSSNWHREQEEHYPEPSGQACNFWNLWKEDFALLSELEHRMFRMSIEWSRIEPEEGRHDEEALKRYLAMFEELKRRGCRLFLTLHHFSHPQWFQEKGEFRKRENVVFFLRHLEYLVPKIAQYVDLWNIFNEFNNGDSLELYDRKANCLFAHARAAALIRNWSKAPISTAHAMCPYQPHDPEDEFDVARTRIRNWVINDFFYHAIRTGEILFPYRNGEVIDGLKHSCDFWAINYYTRTSSPHGPPTAMLLDTNATGSARSIGISISKSSIRRGSLTGCADCAICRSGLPKTASAATTTGCAFFIWHAICRRFRKRSNAPAMCAATSTGHCLTTTNGPASFLGSAWSGSISKPFAARRDRPHISIVRSFGTTR